MRLKALIVVFALAAPLSAQTSGPGAVPAPAPRTTATFYSPLYGGTAGITLPIGNLADDHAAGYELGGLIEYAVSGQPYSLRGEAMFQRFPAKSGHPGADDANVLSLGPTVVYRLQRATTQTYLAGGIAIYNATHQGTRPGFNAGGGVEIPLAGFTAIAEARLHVMLSDATQLMLPLTVGIRF
jgi:hypothetical protein